MEPVAKELEEDAAIGGLRRAAKAIANAKGASERGTLVGHELDKLFDDNPEIQNAIVEAVRANRDEQPLCQEQLGRIAGAIGQRV